MRASPFVLAGVLGLALDARCDLLAHWKFDEPGGLTAFDSAGANHGTLFGSAVFVAGGVSGGAVSLASATDGVVSMGDVFPMTNHTPMTFQVWVMPSPSAVASFPLSRHTTGTLNGYFFAIGVHGGGFYGQPDRPHFYASHPGGSEARAGTIVTDGQWHQLVAVYDGVISRIYVDGTPVEGSSKPSVVGANSAPFLVGGYLAAGKPKGRFDGLIDDVQVYGCALGEAAIQWLFENPGHSFACDADCDRDCDLDVFDYLCFLDAFANQDPYADCENDADWDVFDFLCFQGKFSVGCG